MDYTLSDKPVDFKVLKEDPYIQEEFKKYKETDDYKNYTEMVKADKPLLSGYLVELCIFGFFYEELRKSMNDEQLQKYNSLFTLAEDNDYIQPNVPSEYVGIKTYENEEEYLRENPEVKPMKMTIDKPFTPQDSETAKVIDFKELK